MEYEYEINFLFLCHVKYIDEGVSFEFFKEKQSKVDRIKKAIRNSKSEYQKESSSLNSAIDRLNKKLLDMEESDDKKDVKSLSKKLAEEKKKYSQLKREQAAELKKAFKAGNFEEIKNIKKLMKDIKKAFLKQVTVNYW